MRFLFVSTCPESLFLAQRLELEGNDVILLELACNTKAPLPYGQGLLRKVVRVDRPRWAVGDLVGFLQQHGGRDSIVIFDGTSSAKVPSGKAADLLREAGYGVIGASATADTLELNREFATRLMRLSGIPTPATMGFTDFAKARDFAQAHSDFLVFKPSGNVPSDVTIVADDTQELLNDMQIVEDTEKGVKAFELQERVSGIEVSFEGYFDGHDWIPGSLNSTLEEKKLLVGNLGPNTGCMGNLVWFWRHAEPDLFQQTLKRLTPLLRRWNFSGPLDINTKGGKALEFTPRFGYDAYNSWLMLLDDELGRVFADLARGVLREFPGRTDAFAGSLRLTVPPYPEESGLDKIAGRRVEVADEVLPWYHPTDVAVDERGELVMAGHMGIVGIVNAVSSGTKLPEALQQIEKDLFDRAREVRVQDVQYRTDLISFRIAEELPVVLRDGVQDIRRLATFRGKPHAGSPVQYK